jgi:hypothetical protein
MTLRSTFERLSAAALAVVAAVLLGGCIPIPIPIASEPASGTASTHAVSLKLPPAKAAHCFARNAEEHSSALAAEVRTGRDGRAETIVRVKNGVTYATGRFQPMGSGSRGEIELMVKTSGRQSDLIDALFQGC